jgi:hypothetical protein
MMRRYEQGTNQTPQTNALQLSPYTVRAFLKAGEDTSVAYGVYEIESFDNDKKHYVVVRPTEDSIPQAQLLIGPGHPVEAGKPFVATQTTDAITAAADTGQTVAVGDDIGTQADSYKLKVDNTGFKALRYESTEGRCLVRPFSSGGSVPTPQTETFTPSGTINLNVTGSSASQVLTFSDLSNPIDVVEGQLVYLVLDKLTAGGGFQCYGYGTVNTGVPAKVTVSVGLGLYDASGNILAEANLAYYPLARFGVVGGTDYGRIDLLYNTQKQGTTRAYFGGFAVCNSDRIATHCRLSVTVHRLGTPAISAYGILSGYEGTVIAYEATI